LIILACDRNNLEARTYRQKLEREREEHRQRLKRELDDHNLQLATREARIRHLEDGRSRMKDTESRNAAKLQQRFTVELDRRLAEALALQHKSSQDQLHPAYYQGPLHLQRKIEARHQDLPAAAGHARSPVKTDGRHPHHQENERCIRASPKKVDAPIITSKIKPLERNVHSDGDIWIRSAYPLSVDPSEKAQPSREAFHIKPLERNARSADANMWNQGALWVPQSARLEPKPATAKSTSWFRSGLRMLRQN
jgi:hypothetical protein